MHVHGAGGGEGVKNAAAGRTLYSSGDNIDKKTKTRQEGGGGAVSAGTRRFQKTKKRTQEVLTATKTDWTRGLSTGEKSA